MEIEKELCVAMRKIVRQLSTTSDCLNDININSLAERYAEGIEKDLEGIPLDAKEEECKELIGVTIAGFKDQCEHKVAKAKFRETLYYMSVNEMLDLIKIGEDLSEYYEDSSYWKRAKKVIDALKDVLHDDNDINRIYLNDCLKELKDIINR